jgi:hypothetical protein
MSDPRAPTEPAVGSASRETPMQPAYGDVPRRGIKPMEGNEVHAAGNGRVHYGFVGGGKPSTGRRVSMLYTSITRCAARPEF